MVTAAQGAGVSSAGVVDGGSMTSAALERVVHQATTTYNEWRVSVYFLFCLCVCVCDLRYITHKVLVRRGRACEYVNPAVYASV